MGKAGVYIAGAGAAMTALGSKARDGIASLLRPVAEVEDAAAALQTVWTPVGESMESSIARATGAAKQWERETSQTAKEYLDTAYLMGSAGLKANQGIAGTEAALRAARATFGSGSDAANLLATLYNTLGDKAVDAGKEMNRLGDAVTYTQRTFQIKNLQQLQDGLTYGIPVAKQYEMRLEELLSVLGHLNNAGLQGAQAGTALRSTMTQMGKAAKTLGFQVAKTSTGGLDFAGTMDNIRAKYGSFGEMSDKTRQKFQDAFGTEGLAALTALVDQTDSLRAQMLGVKFSAGSSQEAFGILEKTGSARLQKLENRWTQTKAKFGEAMLPHLEKLLPLVTKWLDQLDQWINKNEGATSSMGKWAVLGTALLSVLGPVLVVLGGLMSALGGVVKAVGWAFGALRGLGRGFLWVLRGARGLWRFVGGPITNAFRWLARHALRLATRLGGVRAAFRVLGRAVAKHPIVAAVIAIAGVAAILVGKWDWAKVVLIEIWEAIKDNAKLFFGGILNLWPILPEGLKDSLKAMWQWVVDLGRSVYEIFEPLAAWIGTQVMRFYHWGRDLWNSFMEGAKEVWRGFRDWLSDLLDELKQSLIDPLLEKARPWWEKTRDFVSDVVSPLETPRRLGDFVDMAHHAEPAPRRPKKDFFGGLTREFEVRYKPQPAAERAGAGNGKGDSHFHIGNVSVQTKDAKGFADSLKQASRESS